MGGLRVMRSLRFEWVGFLVLGLELEFFEF